MAITTWEEAQAAANQIRSGQLSEEESTVLMNEIRAFRNTHLAPPKEARDVPEKEGFFKGMADSVEKRQLMLTDIFEATAQGEQSYAEGALQTVGKFGAGLAADFLAEAVKTGGRGLNFVTMGKLYEGAAGVGNYFAETEIGQKGIDAALAGVEEYNSFAEEHPRAARNLEAAVNIAALITPVKGGKVKPLAKGDSRIGDALRISADGREYRLREDFVRDLVSPKVTPKVAAEQVPRTTVNKFGPFKWKTVEPTQAEAHAAQAVWGIPGVTAKNTLVENRQAIWNEIQSVAAKLESDLKSKDVVIPLSKVQKMLDDTKRAIPEHVVVGDARNAADAIIDSGLAKLKPFNLGDKPHVLLSDVFKMRKEIDMDFRRAGRDPAKYAEMGTAENGQYIALNELRTATNKFVHENARTEVQGSLARQAAMYKALDNVTVKAADEAASTIGMIWQRAMRILPIRGEANQMAAIAFGTGGLGAGAIISAAFRNTLLAGAGGFGLWKALASPQFRRGLAVLADGMKATPANIARMGGNAAVAAHRLRADRAYLLDLLKLNPESIDEPIHPDYINQMSNDQDREKKREKMERSQ